MSSIDKQVCRTLYLHHFKKIEEENSILSQYSFHFLNKNEEINCNNIIKYAENGQYYEIFIESHIGRFRYCQMFINLTNNSIRFDSENDFDIGYKYSREILNILFDKDIKMIRDKEFYENHNFLDSETMTFNKELKNNVKSLRIRYRFNGNLKKINDPDT